MNGEASYDSPVIIHRAILGSIERMVAILLETYGKDLPFWLSPRQIALIPVHADEYAEKIKSDLMDLQVKIYNEKGDSLSKRVRNAEVDGFKLVCIVGKVEVSKNEINIRFKNQNKNYSLENFNAIVRSMNQKKLEFESSELSKLSI